MDPMVTAGAGLVLVILAIHQVTTPTTAGEGNLRVLFFLILGLIGLYLMFTEGRKLLDAY